MFTNPELLRETFASDGENLVRGMQLLAEDIERGSGKLKIRQTDPSKFEVGRNLAITPGKVVYQNPLMQLIQYEPGTEKVLKRPLLIVPPWINKFYILDLNPEKSFINWAVEQGHTVFVISWVNPDENLADKSFEDYMREGIFEALDAVEQGHGRERPSMRLATASAARCSRRPWPTWRRPATRAIKSATFLTAQVDFKHAGDLKVFSDEDQIQAIERDMAERGYLDSSKMATIFNLLRSNDLIWPYIVNVYQKGKEPLPFDLLYWNSDSTRMPAANHSFYLRRCYLQNDLSEGRMEFGGTEARSVQGDHPDLPSRGARGSHRATAIRLCRRATLRRSSDVRAGRLRAHRRRHQPAGKGRYQHWTAARRTARWRVGSRAPTSIPGSWWPHWQAWIEAKDRAGGRAEIDREARDRGRPRKLRPRAVAGGGLSRPAISARHRPRRRAAAGRAPRRGRTSRPTTPPPA